MLVVAGSTAIKGLATNAYNGCANGTIAKKHNAMPINAHTKRRRNSSKCSTNGCACPPTGSVTWLIGGSLIWVRRGGGGAYRVCAPSLVYARIWR